MIKSGLFSLIVFLFSVIVCSGQQKINQGVFYLNDLQYQKARNFFIDQLKTSPADVRSSCSLGDTYLALQIRDSAKLCYQKAQSLDPKSPFPLIGLGRIAFVEDDVPAELDYFERARKMDRKNPEVYCEIAKGCISLTKKDTTTASKFLSLGLELNTNYAPLHIVFGDYELLCHRHGSATNAYQRAYYYDPNSALAYRKLGVIHTYARAYRDALNALVKSVELNNDQILVYKNLGDLYYLIGKYPEAEKNYQIYMSRAEITYEDRERYAIILFFNKRYPEAAKLLEDTLNHKLDVSVLFRIRGYIAYETGEYSKGVEYMSKFFKLHDPEKNIVSDYIYYSRLLQKAGKDTLAIRNYNKALALDSTKTDIYDELAKLYTSNKMHLDAVANYKKMIAIGADKVSTYFMIGKEYSYAGEIYRQKYDSLYALQRSNNIPFTDSTSVNNLKRLYFQMADSAFLIVTALNLKYAGGFIWRGRLNALLDPEAEKTDAKEAYEKALGILEPGDVNKNRRSMIECYRYLGSYYFLSSERLFKADIKQSEALKATSIDYFRKILKLDPNDTQALDVFKKLKIAP
ncbi:MAG: hypothetical protein WCL21_04920 [Mariniphaga sp.]